MDKKPKFKRDVKFFLKSHSSVRIKFLIILILTSDSGIAPQKARSVSRNFSREGFRNFFVWTEKFMGGGWNFVLKNSSKLKKNPKRRGD